MFYCVHADWRYAPQTAAAPPLLCAPRPSCAAGPAQLGGSDAQQHMRANARQHTAGKQQLAWVRVGGLSRDACLQDSAAHAHTEHVLMLKKHC
jgi:hypothetical protein